jgi:hypothetical protein
MANILQRESNSESHLYVSAYICWENVLVDRVWEQVLHIKTCSCFRQCNELRRTYNFHFIAKHWITKNV